MFCTNCGNRHGEGARFCATCGTPVEARTAANAADGPGHGATSVPTDTSGLDGMTVSVSSLRGLVGPVGEPGIPTPALSRPTAATDAMALAPSVLDPGAGSGFPSAATASGALEPAMRPVGVAAPTIVLAVFALVVAAGQRFTGANTFTDYYDGRLYLGGSVGKAFAWAMASAVGMGAITLIIAGPWLKVRPAGKLVGSSVLALTGPAYFAVTVMAAWTGVRIPTDPWIIAIAVGMAAVVAAVLMSARLVLVALDAAFVFVSAVASDAFGLFLGPIDRLTMTLAGVVLAGAVWGAADRRRVTAPPALQPAAAPGLVTPGYAVPAAASTNAFAVAALILGILGFSVLSIIFGALALSQIKSSGGLQRGRGMAIWGIVLGIVWTVALIGIYIGLFVWANSIDSSY